MKPKVVAKAKIVRPYLTSHTKLSAPEAGTERTNATGHRRAELRQTKPKLTTIPTSTRSVHAKSAATDARDASIAALASSQRRQRRWNLESSHELAVSGCCKPTRAFAPIRRPCLCPDAPPKQYSIGPSAPRRRILKMMPSDEEDPSVGSGGERWTCGSRRLERRTPIIRDGRSGTGAGVWRSAHESESWGRTRARGAR